MRHAQYTLSCQDVAGYAVHWLLQSLGWVSGLARVGPQVLVQLLVRAAAEMRSLSAIVQQAAALPSFETIRLALLAYLPSDPLALLPATTRALHARLPKSLRRRPRTMAIDLHLRPFYGDKRTPGTYRGQPKASTKTFFAYATLLVIRCGQAFTVGLTPVRNGEEQTAILGRLLQQARQAGLRVRRLLLDRGFYAATTIAWLQAWSLPFVMPLLRRGRGGKTKAACTGTAGFFVPRRRGWAKYTWTARPRRGGRKQAALRVTIDVCMAPRGRSARGRPKGPLVYACWGIRGTPAQVVACYRKRFRIETSYRQLGQGLALTCSTNRAYRLLLVAIALVLRNLWVWLHWAILAERTAAGRRLHLERLRLRQLTGWLIRALDEILGVRTHVATT